MPQWKHWCQICIKILKVLWQQWLQNCVSFCTVEERRSRLLCLHLCLTKNILEVSDSVFLFFFFSSWDFFQVRTLDYFLWALKFMKSYIYIYIYSWIYIYIYIFLKEPNMYIYIQQMFGSFNNYRAPISAKATHVSWYPMHSNKWYLKSMNHQLLYELVLYMWEISVLMNFWSTVWGTTQPAVKYH